MRVDLVLKPPPVGSVQAARPLKLNERSQLILFHVQDMVCLNVLYSTVLQILTDTVLSHRLWFVSVRSRFTKARISKEVMLKNQRWMTNRSNIETVQ